MRLFTKISLLIALVIFQNKSIAQVSIGGQPESLKKSYKANYEIKELAAISQNWINNQELAAEKNGTLDLISKNIETNYTLSNSGTWEEKKNGDRIWRLKIKANGAQGINPLFKNFYLPEGSKLFVYNEDYSQVLGAYTFKNNHNSGYFATEIIFGDVLVLEYYEPKEVKDEGHFTIEKVGSFYKDLIHVASKGFGDSQNCQVNINCSEGSSWQTQKRGIARILVQSAQGSGWCSGSLINNTSQNKPYFLTAYHCGNNSSASQFNQWIFYFNYEYSGCASAGSEPNSNSITGAQVIARSNDLNASTISSDFLLLELNTNVPSSYNAYYNGWTTAAPTNSGVCIHHPSGDVKKISRYNTTPSSVGVVWSGSGYSLTNGSTHWSIPWASSSNGHGVTEGGSSGSPLFNSNGLIIGTLSGGSSSCTNTNQKDQYGKFSYHWTSNSTATTRRLQPWLDSNNSGVSTLAGSNTPGNSGTPTLDAALTSFLSPTNSTCDFTVTPVVVLKNNGTIPITSATISYQVNSGNNVTFNWTGNLAANASENISLATFTTSSTSNTISATVSNPNNGNDKDAGNNTINLNFEAGVTKNLPFYEDFEANPNTTENLSVVNGDNAETWSFSPFGGFSKSSNGVFVDNWDYDALGQYDWFVTEAYDFTDLVNEELYFDLAYTYYQQTNGTNVSYDSLGIAVSLDCGKNFAWLWKEGGVELATKQGGLGVEFEPSASDWETKKISLNDLNGESSVQFAFIAINGYGNNVYLDNILIGKDYVKLEKVSAFENAFKLYPNPTKDILNVAYNIKNNENLSFSIVNMMGQEVTIKEIINAKKGTLNFNISNLHKGVYFVHIKGDKDQKVLKFIKE